jgi:hypothetical protein
LKPPAGLLKHLLGLSWIGGVHRGDERRRYQEILSWLWLAGRRVIRIRVSKRIVSPIPDVRSTVRYMMNELKVNVIARTAKYTMEE